MGTVRGRTEGFVLAGGRSLRFGADKFEHLVEGRTMGALAVDALGDLGSVTAVGPPRASMPEVSWWSGSREGEGPLGPLVDVLERSGPCIAVVLACDYPRVGRALVERLVAALADGGDAALATDGRIHWLVGAWRAERAVGPLSSAWERGERSIHRAVSGLAIVMVEADEAELVNANRRADVGA